MGGIRYANFDMNMARKLKLLRKMEHAHLNNFESIEALEEIERLKSALTCCNSGLNLVYDALRKGCHEEVTLLLDYHLAKLSKALGI